MTASHATKRLRAPDGTRADIDVMLVPLIKALWSAGYETVGSCQDLGDSLKDYDRKHAYWQGYVLLEMFLQDTYRLLDTVKDTPQFKNRMHWAVPGAWEVSLPVMPFSPFGDDGGAEVGPWAQIHFPNDQIDDLIKVISEA